MAGATIPKLPAYREWISRQPCILYVGKLRGQIAHDCTGRTEVCHLRHGVHHVDVLDGWGQLFPACTGAHKLHHSGYASFLRNTGICPGCAARDLWAEYLGVIAALPGTKSDILGRIESEPPL